MHCLHPGGDIEILPGKANHFCASMIIHKQRSSIGFIDDEFRFLQLCKLIVMIVVVEEVLCPARPFVIRRNLIAELGPSLKLLWSMSSDGSTYTAMLNSSKPNVWISGGTADETSTSMVGNKVFLYAPTTARVLGFYAMKTHDANGFAKDASRTILSVQGTSEGSSLTVRGLSVFGPIRTKTLFGPLVLATGRPNMPRAATVLCWCIGHKSRSWPRGPSSRKCHQLGCFCCLVAFALAHKLFSLPVKRFVAKPVIIPASSTTCTLSTPLGVSLCLRFSNISAL